MYPESIRNAPRLHQDSRGAPVTPGDWLVDSLDATLPPVQVVRLHGAGQFVYLSETGAELTSFCCCFTICPSPAQERLGDSLAAPAEAGQGVSTFTFPVKRALSGYELHSFIPQHGEALA